MRRDDIELQNESAGLGDCPGIVAAGAGCDIRGNGSERPDVALFRGSGPMRAAGVFTRNDVRAAPVTFCETLLNERGGEVGGCVANAGNANACTGREGMDDARAMSRLAAEACDRETPFLVCSTGRIGRRLPMERVRRGIAGAASALEPGEAASRRAADAILTSDTRRKTATARVRHAQGEFTVAGMAKGAGMIEPNMGTMLAFLATDLRAETATLRSVLSDAVDVTFNRITIDGDMSTNDTALLFATEVSDVAAEADADLSDAFREAVRAVSDALAEAIVGDGEKITKVVELRVGGARDDDAAERVARAVGNSLLVKTSWYGNDPNWGRLLDAAGYARVGLDPDDVDVSYDDCPALIRGVPQEDRLDEWRAIVARPRFRVTFDLRQGEGAFRLLANDLSEAYVDFNKSE